MRIELIRQNRVEVPAWMAVVNVERTPDTSGSIFWDFWQLFKLKIGDSRLVSCKVSVSVQEYRRLIEKYWFDN